MPNVTSRPARVVPILGLAVAFAAAAPSPAAAQAPANDNRANAQVIPRLPADVEGTTVGATRETSDPRPFCGPVETTVWYRLESPPPRRIVIRIRAGGNLDAVVAVYRRTRSRLSQVACVPTDERGRGALAFDVTTGDYLILVGKETDSEPGPFSLALSLAEPPSEPPGRPLPRTGAVSTLNPLTDTDDAWSFRMRSGVTYKVNLVTFGECMALSLYGPRVASFAAAPDRYRRCGGYMTFTPEPREGGLYSLLVESRRRGTEELRYRIQAGRLGRDDTAPGLELLDRQTRRGYLQGNRIDVVDLYRFDLRRRSEITLRLAARADREFDLLLLTDTGPRLRCECFGSGSLTLRHRPVRPGRYYAVVRAREGSVGRYRLSLRVRTLTTTVLRISGARRQTAPLGRSVVLEATVTPPPAGGVVEIRVDRFDPLDGWQFFRIFRPRVSGGAARRVWTPPTEGRWRTRAEFLGTSFAASSTSGVATLVVGPS